MTSETENIEAAEAADEATKAPDPDERIKVRWNGPPRVFPDYTRAIAHNRPDRRPAIVHTGDILEIRRRERTPDHADTEAKADPINVISEE